MAISPRSVPQDLSSLVHVIVLGGGFGGVAVAKSLAGKDVRVTIIDQHNFHTFQPLLYQVATAGLEPADVAFPIRTIFGHAANVRFRHGRVRSVDQSRTSSHSPTTRSSPTITSSSRPVPACRSSRYPGRRGSRCRSTRCPTLVVSAIAFSRS